MATKRMGRPPLPPGQRLRRVNTLLPLGLIGELDELVGRRRAAGEYTYVRNDAIREAVTMLLVRDGDGPVRPAQRRSKKP